LAALQKDIFSANGRRSPAWGNAARCDSGLSTLKLFGQSEVASKSIVHISDRSRAKTLKVLRVAFLSGAALEFIVGMLASAAFSIYPLVLPAVNKANSLTIQNASSSAYAQTVGLAWWSFSMLLALSYFIITYRLFWGKVSLSSREGY
jgi:ABC-type transport system involved in cytochrome bd biosynthesis fused ATPase/permease subunit